MRGKTILARTGAAVLGASMALMGGALPAGADQAQGSLDMDERVVSYHANLEHKPNTPTKLFALRLDSGDLLKLYCVELNVGIDEGNKELVLAERPWDQFPNEHSPFHDNREQINWVLHHGYPAVDLGALEDLLVAGGATFNDGLNEDEAITATQSAVWLYSDGQALNRTDPTVEGDEKVDADVLAVYDYLTGDKNVGIGEKPNPTLEISPEEATGEAGNRVGPFTVSTTGAITELVTDLPEGVTVTDADGNELVPEDITDGTEVYFDVPADAAEGNGSFELTINGAVQTGRLFVSTTYEQDDQQSLIVAASEKVSLSADAKGNWTAAPPIETTPPQESSTPAPPTTSEVAVPPTTEAPVNPQSNEDDLAQTGFSAMTPLLLGGGLLVAGGATLLLLRRRNAA